MISQGWLILFLLTAFVGGIGVFARRAKPGRFDPSASFDETDIPPPRRRLEKADDPLPNVIARGVRVAGLRHQAHAFGAWAEAVARAKDEGVEYGLDVQWEPDNRFDGNAHKVIGWARTAGIEQYHIGYVPADLADMLVELKGSRYPVTARLLWIGKSEVAFELRSSTDAPDLGDWAPEARF